MGLLEIVKRDLENKIKEFNDSINCDAQISEFELKVNPKDDKYVDVSISVEGHLYSMQDMVSMRNVPFKVDCYEVPFNCAKYLCEINKYKTRINEIDEGVKASMDKEYVPGETQEFEIERYLHKNNKVVYQEYLKLTQEINLRHNAIERYLKRTKVGIERIPSRLSI